MDFSDHVWNEVYLPISSSPDSPWKWFHADPCENIFDKPLLYESGWNKKITFCIAFSSYEIIDVTKRYTTLPEYSINQRRVVNFGITKDFFVNLIKKMDDKLKANIDQREWVESESKELNNYLEYNKKYDFKNLPGRSSGSTEWRQSRAEIGSQSNNLINNNNNNNDNNQNKVGPYQKWMLYEDVKNLKDGLGSDEDRFYAGSSFLDTSNRSAVITEKRNDQCGAIWVDVNKYIKPNTASLSKLYINFRFVIKNSGADGFAFVIQSQSKNALGAGGCDLGYGKIQSGVAIEFDNYCSADRCDDPPGNHIAIQLPFKNVLSSHHRSSLAICEDLGGVKLDDGREHEVIIVFDITSKRIGVGIDNHQIIERQKF